MNRRAFLAAIAAAQLARAEESPRNQLCAAANDFHAPYAAWAGRMNSGHPGTIPADAVEAFQPLPALWRQVERKFRTWIRGY